MAASRGGSASTEATAGGRRRSKLAGFIFTRSLVGPLACTTTTTRPVWVFTFPEAKKPVLPFRSPRDDNPLISTEAPFG